MEVADPEAVIVVHVNHALVEEAEVPPEVQAEHGAVTEPAARVLPLHLWAPPALQPVIIQIRPKMVLMAEVAEVALPFKKVAMVPVIAE